jgi:hypothetical protein
VVVASSVLLHAARTAVERATSRSLKKCMSGECRLLGQLIRIRAPALLRGNAVCGRLLRAGNACR